MQKKTILALAVGTAFAAPAFAQTTGSTIEIYGRVYPAVASFKATGATTGQPPSNLLGNAGAGPNDFKQRWSVDTYNSRVGFRGREPLGGGLSAIWQMEQRVDFDVGTQVWANRDSFLGLQGGFGTIRLGRFDTIHNDWGNVTNVFGIKSGHFMSLTSLVTDSGLGGGGTGFDTRRSNSVKYETPEFGGFQVGFSWSPDETKGNPGRSQNADLYAAAVKWTSGPFYVSVQYERHNDHFDGSITSGNALIQNATAIGAPASSDARSQDTSMRLSGRWQITPNHRIAGDIGQLEYKESGQLTAGRFENYKKIVWQLGWEASWGGPWRTAFIFGQASDGDCALSGGVECSTSGLKSSQFTAAVAYDFSKRTFVYGGFAQLNLGESAVYDNWTNGTPPRGADVQQFGIGIAHSF